MSHVATSLQLVLVATLALLAAVQDSACTAEAPREGPTNRRGPAAVPSITGEATASFFEYASDVAVKLLKKKFEKAYLGDIVFRTDIPVVGTFETTLNKVRLQGLDVSRSHSGLQPGPGKFFLAVSALEAVVNADFHFRHLGFPDISGSAAVEVTANNGNMEMELGVLNDGVGHAKVLARQPARLGFDGVRVNFYDAKLAFLYNFIAAIAASPIQDAITQEVAAQVTREVPLEVTKLLAGLPLTVDVKGLELNISLAGSPEISEQMLLVRDWGRFQSPGGVWQECPYKHSLTAASSAWLPAAAGRSLASHGKAVPGVVGGGEHPARRPRRAPRFLNNTDPMLMLTLDQSIVNCFTWDLFERGVLAKAFAGDQLPQRALWTDTWRWIAPELAARYPGPRPMGLAAAVDAAPNTAIRRAEGVTTRGHATLAFYLANPEEGIISIKGSEGESSPMEGVGESGHAALLQPAFGPHLFTLNVSGQLRAAKVALEADLPARPGSWRLAVRVELALDKFLVGVAASSVGPLNAPRLQLLFSLVGFLVQEQINNDILKDGFPLPDIDHIRVTQPDVSLEDGAIALGFDARCVLYAQSSASLLNVWH